MSSEDLFPRPARIVLDRPGADDPLGPPDSPQKLRSKFDQLTGQRKTLQAERDRKGDAMKEIAAYLERVPAIDAALEKLSHELFGKLSEIIENHLTLALQEVLNQPIKLKIERNVKRGAATMRFYIEREGAEEDIMRGQGGSVANILSVGLRIFALAQLDPRHHRRFLVLDEQDCWLAPELVPRLVKIVQQAAKSLGFQVLMISHHSTSCFEPMAQKICTLVPTAEGISVEEWSAESGHPD